MKQLYVTLASVEAEFMAVAELSKAVVQVGGFLHDRG